MDIHEIEAAVSQMIEECSGIHIDKEQYETDFFSKSISLTPYYLVYIFFELQNRFEIKFKEEDILNGKFKTVRKVSELVLAG